MEEKNSVYVLNVNMEADDPYYPDYQVIAGIFSTYEKAHEAAEKLDQKYKDKLAPGWATYHGCNIVAYTLDWDYDLERTMEKGG